MRRNKNKATTATDKLCDMPVLKKYELIEQAFRRHATQRDKDHLLETAFSCLILEIDSLEQADRKRFMEFCTIDDKYKALQKNHAKALQTIRRLTGTPAPSKKAKK